MSLSLFSRNVPRAAAPSAQDSPRKELICRETLLLLVICTADTLSSALLFHHNLATEANPLLRPFAEAGVGQFVAAKTAAFIPQLAVGEWYRRWRPEIALPLLRWVAAAYVGIFGILVLAQILG